MTAQIGALDHKNTQSTIKGGLTKTRADVLRVNRLHVAITTTHLIHKMFFGKVISAEKTGSEKQQKKSILHLSALFHCRFSCASLATCCCAALSSCRRPSCRRFQSGRFPDRPTRASLLQQKMLLFDMNFNHPNIFNLLTFRIHSQLSPSQLL